VSAKYYHPFKVQSTT